MNPLYDLLAPYYREISEGRKYYLESVDDWILANATPGGMLLDMGCADGVRGMGLARALDATAVLADNSKEMYYKAKELNPYKACLEAAETINIDHQFDTILMLWNVLGHIPEESRVRALQNMGEHLTRSGKLFLDVNNRHNYAYGKLEVLKRRFIDYFDFRTERGDTKFEWTIHGQKIPASGHLFTPYEVESLIEDADLKIIRRITVDYATGRRSTSPHGGQLVYQLGRNF
jgi:SAM-dependent methyltransferase